MARADPRPVPGRGPGTGKTVNEPPITPGEAIDMAETAFKAGFSPPVHFAPFAASLMLIIQDTVIGDGKDCKCPTCESIRATSAFLFA